MKFKITQPQPNVICLIFERQQDLCKYLIRMEEYYESPEFAGKVFSLNEYKNWYVKTTGKWSYYTDWRGFNIPGHIINEFKTNFTLLRKCEKEVLQQLPSNNNFYLIASYKGVNSDVMDHEIAHAMFYLNQDYKKEMTKLVSLHIDKLSNLSNWILKSYGENVLIDELQAYLSTSSNDWFNNKQIQIDFTITKPFIDMYKKYNNPN